jgi:pimeloyl-ACP methyl ester carboxylesterase
MSKYLLVFTIILVSILLAACRRGGKDISAIAADIAAIDAQVGAITRIDCPLPLAGEKEGESYYCGVYTVPLDYANPDGATLNLAFQVLKATNANPLPDPIVFLAGGPGQSGVVAAGGQLYGDLRQERDLVFPAQRGTLFSHRLALEECVALLGEQMGRSELNAFAESFAGLDAVDRSLPYAEYLAQYTQRSGALNQRCHGAFSAAGLDPAQFTTANSAQDLVGLLAALGYDSYNLHGVSYGARLALETLRRHPDAPIRSVVLDSPVDPAADRLAVAAGAVHGSVMRLFEVCAADAACNAAYPDLVQRTNALIDRLAAQPITAGDQTVGVDAFITQLTDLSNTRANYIPRMIAELEAGDAGAYLALRNGEAGSQPAEGSIASPGMDRLVRQISEAAAQANPQDIMGNIRIVADIISAAQEAQPQTAMKKIAQEKLAGSERLPAILESIDNLSPADLALLADSTGGSSNKPDKATLQKVTDAQQKNAALFMLSGIVCHEQLPFSDVDAALALNNSLSIPTLRASGALLATEVGNCENYPMGEPDPSYNQPVSSDAPILILQGEFDVRTPLANGLALAEQLENATLAVIPQMGHETWASSGCVGQIASSFIRNPDEAPDLSCLQARQERFVLPGEPLTNQGG